MSSEKNLVFNKFFVARKWNEETREKKKQQITKRDNM